MIRKSLIAYTVLFSAAGFSCPGALPTNDPNFCTSFKSVANCYCTSSGVPSSMCYDMNMLYRRMLSVFGTLQKACEYQTYTSVQNCINNWNCYLHGGVDSSGNFCSGTQRACQ